MTSISTTPTAMPAVAVVGTGVIGRSWAVVFARAGCSTRLYDPDGAQIERAMAWVGQELERQVELGLMLPNAARAARALLSGHERLGDALAGASYVQESGPERLDAKIAIFAELDRAADPGAILASSTSALDIGAMARGLPGASRVIVAHPVNPPHVIPAVEVLPGPETAPEVVARTREVLTAVGQRPVVLRSYAVGFALNRLQVALIREAFNLVESGVADVEAIDTLVRDGLGLRWALMGPFGVGHTNADGGVRDYYTRYRQPLLSIMDALGGTPQISPELIEQVGAGTDAMMAGASHADLLAWRDRMIGKIRQLKREDPQP